MTQVELPTSLKKLLGCLPGAAKVELARAAMLKSFRTLIVAGDEDWGALSLQTISGDIFIISLLRKDVPVRKSGMQGFGHGYPECWQGRCGAPQHLVGRTFVPAIGALAFCGVPLRRQSLIRNGKVLRQRWQRFLADVGCWNWVNLAQERLVGSRGDDLD